MTVSEMITDIRRVYPEFPTAEVLALLNRAHQDITIYNRLRVGSTDITLVAGQHEYDLPVGIAKINNVVYWTDANSYIDLTETTLDFLDSSVHLWREVDPSTPIQYFNPGMSSTGTVDRVGFYPAPDTTTSGGYPKITLKTVLIETLVTTGATLPTSSSNMPQNVRNYDLWYYKVLEKIAEIEGDKREATWAFKARVAQTALKNDLATAHGARPVLVTHTSNNATKV